MSLEHSPARDGAYARPLSVTVPTAVAITGIGRSKLYELIKAGKVRIVKIGSRTLCNYSDLERLCTGDSVEA